jgi:hypothetical protein
MGGGVANKKDANTAAAGAFGAGQLDTNLANKNQGRADSLDDTLYGKGGPMMRFLSGSDLNRSDLGGVYKQGFDQTVAAGEKEGSQAYKNIVGQANNSGVGLDSGMSFDAARKNALDKAAMKGSAYATAAGAQHDEALRNFWGAADSAGDDSKRRAKRSDRRSWSGWSDLQQRLQHCWSVSSGRCCRDHRLCDRSRWSGRRCGDDRWSECSR